MLDSRRTIALACALSCLAGFVDAVGFTHLGGLFVSFMSGNSTRLGVFIEEGRWQDAAETAGLIVLFVTGAGAGNLIVLSLKAHRQTWVLSTEGALLALAAAAFSLGYSQISVALTVFAMGLENAVFFSGAGGGIGLTYITGALVKVGQLMALALRGGKPFGWLPNLLQWVALVSGAVFGAIAYRYYNLHAIWFAALLAFALSAVVALTARKEVDSV